MKINLDELERKLRGRSACPDLDQQWPGVDGKPRGPVLCVSYPDCKCGYEDRRMATAASSPPVTLALIEYVRDLETCATRAAWVFDRIHEVIPGHEDCGKWAGDIREFLEKGAVLK